MLCLNLRYRRCLTTKKYNWENRINTSKQPSVSTAELRLLTNLRESSAKIYALSEFEFLKQGS